MVKSGKVKLQKQLFASDNYAGICPEALDCFLKANDGHDLPYGEDLATAEACERFREIFKVDCEVFFVFNGTAGNSLAIASLCQPYHSIISHRYAHVETDECGAPEFFSHGSKILLADGKNGKIQPSAISELVEKRSDIHYPKPKLVSLTQATELGTVYTPEELALIHEQAKRHSLKLHMDGARFANAVAALGVEPREITVDVGIDVLCFGGVKNGLAMGEAVIFFDLEAADEFAYRCKQAGQLSSKMRFLSAPWLGLLKNDTWLRYAKHANDCAALLEEKLRCFPEIEIIFPREANSVFVNMPQSAIASLHEKGWKFYTFIGAGGARLMCSWDTSIESINAFIRDLEASLS